MGLDLRFQSRGHVRTTAGFGTAVGRWGGPVLPESVFRLFDGTGAGQGDDAAAYAFSIAFGAALDYDLKGGTGELNLNGNALSWQTLKYLKVIVTSPASGKELWLGPQGRTNAAALWFPDASAASKVKVRDVYEHADRVTGWPIGASTKLVCLTNPAGSGDPVTGWIIAAGVKA